MVIISKNGDTAASNEMSYYNFHSRVHDKWKERQERERFKQEIIEEVVQEVLKRITVEADVSDAVMNIKELQDALGNLLNGGK